MSYSTVIAEHPPRVIHNETQYGKVLARIDDLMSRELDREETDYLDTLTTLVEAYERRHHEIDTAGLDGIDALQYLLDRNGLNASDLGRLLGNRTLGAAILGRRRELSKAHIRLLCQRFVVSADLFLG